MSSEQPTATQVGYSFVSMYYTTLIQDPKSLYKFYKEESQLTHRSSSQDENEERNVVSGIKDIKSKIESLVYEEGAKVKLTTVDSQKSLNGSVFVCVEGQISFSSMEPLKRFTQSFLLVAQQPKGYYVFNDVFRFVSFAPITSTPDASLSWNTSQNLSTPAQRRMESDNISEADSTAATIGTSSVTGVDDSISQMMKDVDETATMNQSASQQNLNQLNGDESEGEVTEEEEEEEESTHIPSQPAQEQQASQESAPSKTYSTWSQVVGGDEYAVPVAAPTQPEKKQRPRSGRQSKQRGDQDQTDSQSKDTFHRKEREGSFKRDREHFHRKPEREGSFSGKPEKFAVYVSKLQQEVSDQDLRDAFSSFGNIVDVLNKSSGNGGGYALVFYDSNDIVEKVLQQKGKVQVKGNNVHVDKHYRKSSPYTYGTRGRGGGERGGASRGRGRGRGEFSPRSDRGRGRGSFAGRAKSVERVSTTENTQE